MITKEIVEDKIEIVGDFKTIQIRTATIIKEDGVELSRSFHRHMVTIDQADNISNESSEVQSIAATVWTDELKEAKKLANETANENSGI